MTAIYLVLAGLAGLINHYYVRWKQGRTTSSFKEYLLGEWGGTLSSLSANIMSSVGMYMALPDDIGGKLLIGAVYASYAAGYTFDSMLNKDANPSLPPVAKPKKTYEEIAKEVKDEIDNKSLKSVLDDDAAM